MPPPGSCGAAKERVEKPAPDAYALDWFVTFKKLPKDAERDAREDPAEQADPEVARLRTDFQRRDRPPGQQATGRRTSVSRLSWLAYPCPWTPPAIQPKCLDTVGGGRFFNWIYRPADSTGTAIAPMAS